MFKTIIVPIDIAHADTSQTVIDIAAKNGNADSRIILLNIVDEIPNWAAVELPADMQEKSLRISRDTLGDIAEACNAKTEVMVRVGSPYRTILEEADKNGAELIVIASHKPGLQDYLLGSTAAKVVRHAKCSVFVVR